MGSIYHEGQRDLQARFDTTRLADRLEQVKVHATVTDDDRAFIEARDMFFLATADSQGRPNCSYKGGDPGFVRVVSPTTIAFERQRRLRLNGTASVDPADPLTAQYPEAQFVVRVAVREIFPNCPRYIHKYQLVERSRFVPHAGCETPIPDWKRSDWARDVLARGDPAGSS
jgi:hypothetical protein